MIVSFGDRATEDLYHGRATSRTRRFPQDIIPLVLMKLDMLDNAHKLLDVAAPPGNRLGPLAGDFKDLYSIRVNKQWRIVFGWENDDAHHVRLVDYHR